MIAPQTIDYWLAYTSLEEIARRPCTLDPDTCPHCEAQTCLKIINRPGEPPRAFLEGLQYTGQRHHAGPLATYTKIPQKELVG